MGAENNSILEPGYEPGYELWNNVDYLISNPYCMASIFNNQYYVKRFVKCPRKFIFYFFIRLPMLVTRKNGEKGENVYNNVTLCFKNKGTLQSKYTNIL